MVRILVAFFLFAAAVHFAAAAPAVSSAIVVQDHATLRAAPRDGAQQQAVLWQGDVVEVVGPDGVVFARNADLSRFIL